MVLVALVALLMAMVRRREYCLERVRYHHSIAGSTPRTHCNYVGMFISLRKTMREHAAWHYKIADRWTYAAGHPWLPFPTDPPEPSTFGRPSPEMLRIMKQFEPSAARD